MNPFARRTVASITASLARMASDLEAHASAKSDEHARHAALADEALREANTARTIKAKLAGLLS